MQKSIMKYFLAICLLCLVACSGQKQNEMSNIPKYQEAQQTSNNNSNTYKAEILETFNHNPDYFTQGFEIHNGFIYEGTGLNGKSSLLKWDFKTGEVVKSVKLDDKYFGEGITVFKDKIFQITWTSGVCFVYDAKTFKKLKSFDYTGEGWGLTNDDKNLIMSDGTNMIKFLNPDNFSIVKTIAVTDNGAPINNLNELEYIDGEIWANIWMQSKIVVINPETGNITKWIDLSELMSTLEAGEKADVLNGIAYDKQSKKIYLTGKNWKNVFSVKLVKAS